MAGGGQVECTHHARTTRTFLDRALLIFNKTRPFLAFPGPKGAESMQEHAMQQDAWVDILTYDSMYCIGELIENLKKIDKEKCLQAQNPMTPRCLAFSNKTASNTRR